MACSEGCEYKKNIDDFVPNAFIKNIALKIDPAYRLDNTPFMTVETEYTEKKSTQKDKNLSQRIKSWIYPAHDWDKTEIEKKKQKEEGRTFVGRDQLIEKFKRFLQDSSKGVYLVTGFRGLGKTSFVNKVVNDYQKDREGSKAEEELLIVHLTIAQNKPKEFDLLRLLVSSIHEKYKDFLLQRGRLREVKLRDFRNRCIEKLIKNLLWLSIPLFLLLSPDKLTDFIKNRYGFHGLPSAALDAMKMGAYCIFLVATVYTIYWLRYLLKSKNEEILAKEDFGNSYNRIRFLYERCQATITEDSGDTGESNLQGGVRLFIGGKKLAKQFTIADPKEIEFELQQILRLSKEEKIEFLFIFDELDKIENGVDSETESENSEKRENWRNEDAYQRQFREKKQAIISIISGLKNFFSNAQARFIFIAGKEMFDASLADIADRQSALSSMFTYVFNVESFLKEWEQTDNNASLSNAIESYLKSLFFSKNELVGKQDSLLQLLKDKYTKENKLSDKSSKMLFLLQDFITYLVYRSNGSPKKLIKSVHDFIVVDGNFDKTKTHIFSKTTHDTSTDNEKEKGKKDLYLYFNYYNQYRLGFISYLYRPFLVQFGRSLKLYSDGIILSTPYLFDHLLKFHPFAFSTTNLELIPEILSSNKTPYLREYLRQIISYLGQNHIRNTDIDLFDFKFYSRTQNEIKFVSKVFEQEAAAFNFTLDESYTVKLHIRNKIKELRNVYSNFLSDSGSWKHQIFSIGHFNNILGDLHFFDQEYNDAIGAYSDAILPINHLNVLDMNTRDFISLIKNKLKLGLCFERVGSYKDALAFYTDSSMDSRRYMIRRLKRPVTIHNYDPQDIISDEGNQSSDNSKDEKPQVLKSSSLNDLLQVINQAFIAKVIVQEKMGTEGISLSKLSLSLGDFLYIAEQVRTMNPPFDGSSYLIIANAYLLVGKLIYYKNSQQAFPGSQYQPATVQSTSESEPPNIKFIDSLFSLENKFEYSSQKFRNSKGLLGTRRRPVIALYFYLLGICEILKCRSISPRELETITEPNGVANIVLPLLNTLSTHLDTGDEMLTGFHYRYIATLLSSIGDCLLGMLKIDSTTSNHSSGINNNESHKAIDLCTIFNLNSIESDQPKPDEADSNSPKYFDSFDLRNHFQESDSKDFSFIDIIRCYYLSGKYFQKHGKALSMSFQYRKILYVLRLITGSNLSEPNAIKISTLIKNTLVYPCLQAISKNASGGDIHMILKALTFEISYSNALSHISNHPEYREIFFLYNYICIKLSKSLKISKLVVSPESSFSTQFSRLLELDYSAKLLSPIPKDMFLSDKNHSKDIELTINFLFCMVSILRTIAIYGVDYMLGHSYRAYTHLRIANFLHGMADSPTWVDCQKSIQKRLDVLLGQGSYSSLDETYHFTQAIIYYSKAVELHTAGVEYKVALEKMTYLEDDFNDTAYHFGAAMERYLMINDVFSKHLDTCSFELARLIEKNTQDTFGN